MPKALLSVHDKTGLLEFAQGLAHLGWTLLASGGTARVLKENGVSVVEVSDYTGSPEILSGRVKTLHPAIHGGLLARSNDNDLQELRKLGWDYIDLVAVNLYPFEKTIAQPGVTLADAIENIDIGGVTLIRAAAKNYDRVTLICDPQDYKSSLEKLSSGSQTIEDRKALAVKGFSLTCQYDRAIAGYLAESNPGLPQTYEIQSLRYGENPHQTASVYSFEPDGGPLGGKILHGKELSYNNLLDLDAAWRAALSYESTCVAIVKHLSPCGIACGENLVSAYQDALASDPVSAYGGVIAANRLIDTDAAAAIAELFVECVIAPGFEAQAYDILASKKNIRLIEMPGLNIRPDFEIRTIQNGLVRQSVDFGDPPGTQWKVVSKRQPTPDEWKSLRFAWKACQHVKSNAIVFAKGLATVGIGGGQPNRVDCVRIAVQRAGDRSQGAVMASDAYFPFPDSVTTAIEAGITAIVHPGGSIRDTESTSAADEAGIVMIHTGVRHFRH